MPNFSIKESEKKVVKEITFNKESDYKVVKLKSTGKVVLLHSVQADKLISEKKAEVVKGAVEIIEANPVRTVKKVNKTPRVSG